MEAIRVFIADSQYLVRRGLKDLLAEQEDILIIGQAQNEESLIAGLKNTSPDVVLLDYMQSGFFGRSTLNAIYNMDHSPSVLILSSDNDPDRMYQVLGMGVNSYLTKQCEGEEIVNAIRATHKGDRFFCNKVLDLLMDRSFPAQKTDCLPTPLTKRELEIVQLTASGKVAKEIADELHLSPHTVYTHRKNIMKKLNVRSSAELVHEAMKMGFIDKISV